MNWEAAGAIGEILGALAVFVTLVYLAIQIRQNTASGHAQSRQTLLDQWSQSNWELSRDPELLRIYANALQNWPDLPDSEKTMFDLGMGRYLANIQNGLLLYQSDMIDEQTVDMIAGYMLLCARSPGGSKWWSETAMALPETRAYIDKHLASDKNRTVTIESSFPHWSAMQEMPKDGAPDDA